MLFPAILYLNDVKRPTVWRLTRSANGLLEETGAGSTLPEGDCDVACGDVRQSRGVLVGIL